MIALSLGFLLIWLGHVIFPQVEQVLVPVGALTVAISHWLNTRYIKLKSCNKECNVRTGSTF